MSGKEPTPSTLIIVMGASVGLGGSYSCPPGLRYYTATKVGQCWRAERQALLYGLLRYCSSSCMSAKRAVLHASRQKNG